MSDKTSDDERLAWGIGCLWTGIFHAGQLSPWSEQPDYIKARWLEFVPKARELLCRPAESGTVATRCTVYETPCSVHDFIHGAEAEELREGIEKLMENEDAVKVRQLQSLLDRVDARDSLAYLESKDDQHGERRTVEEEALTDGQILYEAHRHASGGDGRWQAWGDLGESTRSSWEQTALAMEEHFAQRMLEKRGAATPAARKGSGK